MEHLEYLAIPLQGIRTTLKLPYAVHSTDEYEVTLKKLTRADVVRSFRIKFVEDKANRSYRVTQLSSFDYLSDNHIYFALHDSKLQLCVTPKGGAEVDDKLRERLHIGS